MAGDAFPAAPRQGWAPSQPCRASLPHEVHAHGRALRVEAAGGLAVMSREGSAGRDPDGGLLENCPRARGPAPAGVLDARAAPLLDGPAIMPAPQAGTPGPSGVECRRRLRPCRGRASFSRLPALQGQAHGARRWNAKGPAGASAAGPVNVWDAEGLRPALPQPRPGRPASADRRGSGSRLPGDRCGTPCPSPRGSA